MSELEPGTREEMLLQGILNGDATTNIEPADRKERLLKAILENCGFPSVTSSDNGKVLKVNNGEWGVGNALPEVLDTDDHKVLKGFEGEWVKDTIIATYVPTFAETYAILTATNAIVQEIAQSPQTYIVHEYAADFSDLCAFAKSAYEANAPMNMMLQVSETSAFKITPSCVGMSAGFGAVQTHLQYSTTSNNVLLACSIGSEIYKDKVIMTGIGAFAS